MIRHLRRKLTAITMVLLTAMLLVIMIFVYHGTQSGLRSESLEALRTADKALPEFPHRPGDKRYSTTTPCFVLQKMPDGTFIAIGSELYDLSDQQELRQLLESAIDTEKEQGVLEDAQLRFLRLGGGPGTRYAFTDISGERNTLSRLNLTCLMILLAGMMGFFCISTLLARWAVRPVESAWAQQRQFIADASHELKTPLTVILTNAELLGDSDYDADSQKRFAGNILTMSRQMRGLVESLLDQARIDNGGIQRQRLDLSQLVEETLLPFEPVYFEAGRNLESHIQPDLNILGSGEHLRRLVEILLDNGCKYSMPNSTVTLHLSRQGKNCLLCVTSSGMPLSPQQCKDIFKRFYRVDMARTMNRSYGLGLPIAQGIVEQHKGKIWAESRPNQNLFFVTLSLC